MLARHFLLLRADIPHELPDPFTAPVFSEQFQGRQLRVELYGEDGLAGRHLRTYQNTWRWPGLGRSGFGISAAADRPVIVAEMFRSIDRCELIDLM
jgi:hypothetical protein